MGWSVYGPFRQLLCHCGRVGGRVRSMGGMACGSTMINIVWCSGADRYQHSNTQQHPVTQWLGWWRLFYLVCSSPSFISIHHSPQAHLRSSRRIVTVYMLTHNVLPASPGRAQEKVNNQQQPPSMLSTHTAAAVQRMDSLPLGTPLLI